MITKLFGMALLFGCLTVVYYFEGTSFASGALRIFHWPAIFLTGMGPVALILLSSDMRLIGQTIGSLFARSPRGHQKRQETDAIFLQKLGKRFYEEGTGVFDDAKGRNLSPLVSKTLERLSLRMPNADIRELLETERDRRQAQIQQCMSIVSLGVRLSPSVGMLGTILGMVQLLSTLSDPSHIGSHMSLALFTTFYGLFFSLALWTPLHHKLERTLLIELDGYDRVVQWLEFLDRRKPADYFADAVDLPRSGSPRAA